MGFLETWIGNKPSLDIIIFTKNLIAILSDNLTMRSQENNKHVRKMKIPELEFKKLVRKYGGRCDLNIESFGFSELCAGFWICVLSLVFKSLLLVTRWSSNN